MRSAFWTGVRFGIGVMLALICWVLFFFVESNVSVGLFWLVGGFANTVASQVQWNEFHVAVR